MNLFADFPSRGLDSVLHLKAHNNPNLRDFPGAARFPRVRSLVLSYAYHCCSFLASILNLYRINVRLVLHFGSWVGEFLLLIK